MSKETQLIGLVYTGPGQADIKGEEAWKRYHGKPQLYYVFDLLSEFASRVIIACDKNQKNRIFTCYPVVQIPKKPLEKSIIATVSSVQSTNPDTDILLVSTDFLPVSRTLLKEFFASCTTDKPAALYNPFAGNFDPLISWYPAAVLKNFKTEFSSVDSTIKFLTDTKANRFIPKDLSLFNFIGQTNLNTLSVKPES